MGGKGSGKGTRRKKLAGETREIVLDLIRFGVSRHKAAEAVEISYQTLLNTEKDDPEFKREMQSASLMGARASFKRIVAHADKDWRADAYLLERIHPTLFGKRNPDTISRAEMVAALSHLSAILIPLVPPERLSEAQDKLAAHLRGVLEHKPKGGA